MRYSSAVVLSTLAVGQAAAAHLHNRHASFHARRQADAKRSAGSDVDWNALAYDLKDVDWSKVNYNNPASSPAPTPAPTQEAPKPTKTPEQKKPEPSVAAVKVEAPASSAAEKPKATEEAKVSKESIGDVIGDITDTIGDVVSDVLHGVASLCKDLGISSIGKNDKQSNGGMWLGNDSPWKAEFTNDANEDAVIFCWKANGFSGMSLNVNQPEISVGLKSGEKVEVSFAPNVPAACAPAYKDTKLALFGGLEQTWWEVTFGQNGAFDVSRNVNMHGRQVHSKGSKCTSDMETCVFKCKDDNAKSCEKGTEYDLFGCEGETGGGGGYDVVMAGTGGGCAMGNSGETVKVSFS